jgi:integrase
VSESSGDIENHSWTSGCDPKYPLFAIRAANERKERQMHLRQRYQHGCLTKKERTRGEDVWEFRYYETTAEGQRRRRSVIVGTVGRYPTRADALREVEPLRLRLNVESRLGGPVTINALVARYIEQELPERHSTRRSYLAVLNRWIRPRWGEYVVDEVKTVAVEQWLRTLQLAPKSKTHIRSLMHLLYQHARRWEMTEKNPIELVRQSSRRLRIPRVLTEEEIRALLAQLTEPYRTMVLVAVCLGLRVSEIIGLKWGDFDWESRTVLVQRAVVQCWVGDTKTETSARPLPLHPALADRLLGLHRRSPYCGFGDWVFANDRGGPRWQETILKRQLKPAAVRAGIGKVGWHTFRHTYSTMLRSAGTDIKVQQELLRHANIQTTMNIYTQAVSDQKRAANSKVVEMVLRPKSDPGRAPEEAGKPPFSANGSEWESDATWLRFPQSGSSD